LQQVATEGASRKSNGDLNKKIPAAARRELQLTTEAANAGRRHLVEQGHLETTKQGQKVVYGLSESGRVYLASLEPPTFGVRSLKIDETALTDEVREGQRAYLLLQLLDADGRSLTKGEANKFRNAPRTRLALTAPIANHRRARLADQGYIQITRAGGSEEYSLTRDGLDYLAAGARHYDAEFKVSGRTLNTLVAAAREHSFERDQSAGRPRAERPIPTPLELAEVVLAEFQELRRERHGRSGLVPVHEVRQRVVERFGPGAGRHDILDDVILDLRRRQRLGLLVISNPGDATEQQLNDSIPGVNGTLFYLEVAREQQPVTEPVHG
jgi:hypothetical protein